MSRSLTASDRSALIRLASTMPAGSEERRAILSGLQPRPHDGPYTPVNYNTSSNDRNIAKMAWTRQAFKKIPGYKDEPGSRYATSGILTDESTLPSWSHGSRVSIVGYLHNVMGGSVSIRGLHGYGEAKEEPGVSANFITFKYVDDPEGHRSQLMVPVEDPVQAIYDAAQEALKKFRKLRVTPLDPLKWQRFERMYDTRFWYSILNRSEVVLQKEQKQKESWRKPIKHTWRWDKKNGHVWYTVTTESPPDPFWQPTYRRSPQAYKSRSEAKAAAKAYARRRTASKNVVASSPTALAKVVRSTPGLESLSDRDSMAVAKGLIKFLLKKLEWLLNDELDDAFDLAESDYEEGEYEAVVYSGGGPSRFGPDGDEAYYDVTEERSFEYAAKVRAPFNLWFRLDDALAEINGISPLAMEMVEENEKALFGALARSRLMESIVKDAIKNQWRTWFKKEVAEYAAEVAETETDEYLDSGLRVMQPPPYNLGYNLKTVTLDSDSKIHIELDVFAAFNEPEIEER